MPGVITFEEYIQKAMELLDRDPLLIHYLLGETEGNFMPQDNAGIYTPSPLEDLLKLATDLGFKPRESGEMIGFDVYRFSAPEGVLTIGAWDAHDPPDGIYFGEGIFSIRDLGEGFEKISDLSLARFLSCNPYQWEVDDETYERYRNLKNQYKKNEFGSLEKARLTDPNIDGWLVMHRVYAEQVLNLIRAVADAGIPAAFLTEFRRVDIEAQNKLDLVYDDTGKA